jgi:uncharacterized protein with von Willebrand factor type A (vWA) domain
MLAEMMQSPIFDQLRIHTRGNSAMGAVATASLCETIMTENEQTITQINMYLQQIAAARQQAAQLRKELQVAKNEVAKAATIVDRTHAITKQQIQQNHLNQITTQINQQMAQVTQLGAGIQCTHGVQTALDAIGLESDICSGWGTATGSLSPVSYEDRLALQQALIKSPALIKILQMAGRMRRLAVRKQRQKSKHVYDEISDVKLGDDLGHLLVTEQLLLADPLLEPLFLKKYAEKSLFCYEMSGLEAKTKGPIIVCLDVSGSMGGERDCWAKGVALAMVDIAHHQKRNCIVIVFDNVIQHIFEFLKEDFQFKRVVELASYFTGGGTSFNPPLGKALDYIEKESQFKQADIIMVTDGDADVSEKTRNRFMEVKEKLKFSLFTIIVGTEYEWVDHPLKGLSDRQVPVADLTKELAEEVFESV